MSSASDALMEVGLSHITCLPDNCCKRWSNNFHYHYPHVKPEGTILGGYVAEAQSGARISEKEQQILLTVTKSTSGCSINFCGSAVVKGIDRSAPIFFVFSSVRPQIATTCHPASRKEGTWTVTPQPVPIIPTRGALPPCIGQTIRDLLFL